MKDLQHRVQYRQVLCTCCQHSLPAPKKACVEICHQCVALTRAAKAPGTWGLLHALAATCPLMRAFPRSFGVLVRATGRKAPEVSKPWFWTNFATQAVKPINFRTARRCCCLLFDVSAMPEVWLEAFTSGCLCRPPVAQQPEQPQVEILGD